MLDLHVTRSLPSGLSVQLGVENVFDRLYATHLNLSSPFDPSQIRVNEPGRTLWLKIRWKANRGS